MSPSNYQVNNIVRSYSRKLTKGLGDQAEDEPETAHQQFKTSQSEFMDRITAGVIGTVASAHSEAGQANRQALHRVAANLQLTAAKKQA